MKILRFRTHELFEKYGDQIISNLIQNVINYLNMLADNEQIQIKSKTFPETSINLKFKISLLYRNQNLGLKRNFIL
jgi:hypothetical protein